MKKSNYVSIAELGRILGISRIAVYKKIRKGQIAAVRIGRSFAIPKKYVDSILGYALNDKDRLEIDKAVHKAVKEYGEVLRLLGRE